MVTQIRSLAVAATLDASAYSSGAQQKVTADKAMSAAGREAAEGITIVGVAAAATSVKITVAADSSEKLKRQYVTGYSAAADFEKALRGLNSAIDKGRITSEQAANAVSNMQQRFGQVAEASDFAAKGQLDLAKAIETANSKGYAQLATNERLIASYRLMASEAKAAFAADQAQALWNQRTGVRPIGSGSASVSASVFSDQLGQQDEIARLKAAQQGQNFARDANAWAGLNGNGTSARESASVFEEAARQSDVLAQRVAALRAQIDPVAASQARLNEELAEYQKFADAAEISTAELATAQALARARHDELTNAMSHGGRSAGLQRFQVTDVAYQAQDVATQAFGGASIGTIALQQGPQLAMAFGDQGAGGALKTLGAGLLTLVSSSNLMAIALVAGGAAAIQFGAKIYDTYFQTKKLDDAISDQQKALKGLAEAYGGVAAQAAKAGAESQGLQQALGSRSQAALAVSTKAAGAEYFNSVGNLYAGNIRGKGDFFASSQFEPFQAALVKLRADTKAGKGDFEEFYNAVARKVELDPTLAKYGDQVITESEKLRQGTEAMKEFKRVQDALFNDRGLNNGRPEGQLLSQGSTNAADRDNYDAYKKQADIAAARAAQTQAALIASINARSDAAKAAAAGAVAEATYNSGESQPARDQRIEDAKSLSRVQSQKDLADAQTQRQQGYQKLLDDQQLETTLIGQTSNATEDLRQKYAMMAAIRADAARHNITDESEIQKQYATEIQIIDQVIDKVRQLIGYRRDTMSRTEAAVAQTQYDAMNAGALADMKRAQGAALGAIGAKSPAELAAAARAQVLASPVDPKQGSQAVLQYRADAAGDLAFKQAQQQLDDAKKGRGLALDQTLEDQREEIKLIGQTGGAVVALRKEYELTSQLQIEAAQRNGQVDQDEIARIKIKAKELGALTDAYNKAKLDDDLSFEKSQLFRSPRDQQIASRQKGAGMPVDLQSSEAAQMRQNMQIASLQEGVKGFASDFQSALVSSGGKIGQAFGSALKDSILREAQKLEDQALDKIANIVVSALTGGAGGAQQPGAVAGGGILGLGGKAIGGLTGNAANNNSSTIGAVVGKTATGIPLSQIATGDMTAKIASDYAPRFQGLLDDLKSKGYPISSLGEGGYSFRNVAGSSHLSNHAFGEALDINPRQNPQAYGATGNWSQYGIDPTGEAKQFGLTYGGNWKLPDTMHFQVDKTADVSSALDKLTTSSTDASNGLGQFGGGIGKLTQSLSSSFFPAAPAAGGGGASGIGGWLSSLFSPAFAPIGGQATKAASGLITGLFADGTDFAPGGPAIVGERGAELVNLPRGSQVVPAHRTRSMMSAAANGNSGANNNSGGGLKDLHVHIDGANGDPHVRTLVSQGVEQGLSAYHEGMRQKGFSQLQSQFVSDKA